MELQKPNRSLAMNLSKSVAELQRGHVVLELECIDRMYLNAYVPHVLVSPKLPILTCHRTAPI